MCGVMLYVMSSYTSVCVYALFLYRCKHAFLVIAICHDIVYSIIHTADFLDQGIEGLFEIAWPSPPFLSDPNSTAITCHLSFHLSFALLVSSLTTLIGGSNGGLSERSPAIAAGSRTRVRGGGAIGDHKSQPFGGSDRVEFSQSFAFHPIDRSLGFRSA